jgi:hypothetical protein
MVSEHIKRGHMVQGCQLGNQFAMNSRRLIGLRRAG